MVAFKVKDSTGVWLPVPTVGPIGPTGPEGPKGQTGVATTIIGEFTTRDVAELPADGNIPADWDGPGTFPNGRQLLVGEALIDNKPASPTIGHLWQFVGPVMVSGWIDVGQVVGSMGPTGPTGPQGQAGTPGTNGATGATGATGPAGPTYTPPASTNHNVTYANGFTGTMDFHVSATMVTLRMNGVSRNQNTAMGAQTKICDYPAGVPAPPVIGTGWRVHQPVRNSTFDMGNNTQHQGCIIHLDGTSVWVVPTGDVLYDADMIDAVITYPR